MDAIHFLTVASGDHPGLELLKHSAEIHGIELRVLGYGQPYQGNGVKLLLLADYARQQNADDIIVYTDAFDSVFLAPEDDFIAALQPLDDDLIFSAEQNFALKAHPFLYLWQNLTTYLRYPSSITPYRFLNAGTFIGRAGRVANLASECGVRAETQSDQTVLSKRFSVRPQWAALDRLHRLMTCNGGRIGLEHNDYTWIDGRLRNNLTRTTPLILHVPGKNNASLWGLVRGTELDLGYRPSPAELAVFRRRRRWHRIVASLRIDNYLFKFTCWNVILLLPILALLWLIS